MLGQGYFASVLGDQTQVDLGYGNAWLIIQGGQYIAPGIYNRTATPEATALMASIHHIGPQDKQLILNSSGAQ